MSEIRLSQIQQMYDSKLAEYKRLGKTDAEFVYVQLADYTFLLSELTALRKERDTLRNTVWTIKEFSNPANERFCRAGVIEIFHTYYENYPAALSEEGEK